MPQKKMEVGGQLRDGVPQFYIGRMVLNDSLSKLQAVWQETLGGQGFRFKRTAHLALRQLDLRHRKLADKASAEMILTEYRMQNRRCARWAICPTDYFADKLDDRQRVGWRNKVVSVILQTERNGEPKPGQLAVERDYLWDLVGMGGAALNNEGIIPLGRIAVDNRGGQSFDQERLAAVLSTPVEVELGQLVVIPEPISHYS